MVLEGGATYWGLSDVVEVVAWVEEDDGTDLYRKITSLTFDLMHLDNVMLSITANAEHYAKARDEDKGAFRSFFLHPPIQHNQNMRISVELNDGRSAKTTTPVMTEKMLKRKGQLSNPAFGGRGAIHYPLPVEKEQE